MYKKEKFKCPKCNHENKIKIYEEVSSNKVKDIINNKIFTHKCANCNEKIVVLNNLKIETDKYVIYFTPNKADEIKSDKKEIMRICDTYDDLKEKLLILEDDLNDIVIEVIKHALKHDLENLESDLIRIRYDGKNDDKLVFYLIGVNKSYGCSINIYNKLLKKMKFKKIDRCVLIDEYTFSKYYKMRLL